MNQVILQKLIFSLASIVLIHLFFYSLKRYAKKTQERLRMRKSRYFAVRRILTVVSILLMVLVFVLVWDLNLKNLWVSATGILALVAIAFFAVWSLIGNILAGVIIYFTSPFKIDDVIEVMPDNIQGTVLAINTFYTVLMNDDGNYINIPNSIFFQKYIQVLSRQNRTKQRAVNPSDNQEVNSK